MKHIIDAHIHLDQYNKIDIDQMAKDKNLKKVISVSMDLFSSQKNLSLSEKYSFVEAAYGFHPEQPLPTGTTIAETLTWIQKNTHTMVAIGEVGLPHYVRKENPLAYPLEPYIELLEQFIILAKSHSKPIILHSVYEEAPIVLDILEKHSYMNAHFHWFKGDSATIERLITNGCFISITPDLLYESEIQAIVEKYPLDKMMVETDGPWPFEGPFHKMQTMPSLIHFTIKEIARIKQRTVEETYRQLYNNTKGFYSL